MKRRLSRTSVRRKFYLNKYLVAAISLSIVFGLVALLLFYFSGNKQASAADKKPKYHRTSRLESKIFQKKKIVCKLRSVDKKDKNHYFTLEVRKNVYSPYKYVYFHSSALPREEDRSTIFEKL